MINLLRKEPLVIFQRTGISRLARKPVAFSALTARSSPRMPAVFLVAILLMVATSSIKAEISSKTAKIPDAINFSLVERPTFGWMKINKSRKKSLKNVNNKEEILHGLIGGHGAQPNDDGGQEYANGIGGKGVAPFHFEQIGGNGACIDPGSG